VADSLKSQDLRANALQIILNEFDNLKKESLDELESNLLAEIYREKTPHPIHLVIEHGRDDVVFLFLLSDLKTKISSKDDSGRTPLKVALDTKHYRIASTVGCPPLPSLSLRDPHYYYYFSEFFFFY